MTRAIVLAAAAATGAAVVVTVLAATKPGPTGSAAEFGDASPYRGSAPPPKILLPHVTLRSYHGQRVNLGALRDRIVVLTFLDSKCTDTCPIIASTIGQTWPLLTRAEQRQVRVYAISVNPRLDTPASVRRFLAARHATGAMDWLSDPVAHMRPIWHAFGILPAIDTGNADVHSADVRVFDRHGEWVSILHTGVDLTPTNLAHDIRLALASSG